jgi:hypothetical protein
LPVGEIGKTRLLDRRDMDEHVLTAVIANDETEALLRVEEFDDAFAFAHDLRGHAAACAAAAKTAAAAAESTTTAAAEAAAAPITVAATTTAAAEAAAIAITTATSAAAFLVAEFAEIAFVAAETFALVAAARTALAFAPFIETHEPSEY